MTIFRTPNNGVTRRRQTAAIAVAVALVVALSGCADYKAKKYTSHDDCRDCPPGLFTGEDGVATFHL
jgi:hypothetical protein